MSIRRKLPVLEEVSLRDFSLYQNMRRVTAHVSHGVFCLAGANGLGKSTFLAAINYGFTGIVANPDRTFRSVNEYYQYSIDYAASYFDGRIEEADRDSAIIELAFRIGSTRYRLARNFFEPKSLRELAITTEDNEQVVDTSSMTGDELHAAYATQIVRDCSLKDFEQFVFLQHFLVTFDERRHLLFWDQTVADSALHLTFGMEAGDAAAADDLRRQIEKQDSLRRNAQWQATAARKRLALLGETVDDETLTQLRERFNELTLRSTEAVNAFTDARRVHESAELRVAELSARHTSLRYQYDGAFSRRVQSNADPRLHPVIQTLLTAHNCEVCGQAGEQITDHVEAELGAGNCPVCRSTLAPNGSQPDFEQLETLDRELSTVQETLTDAHSRAARLRDAVDIRGRELSAAAEALNSFEAENSQLVTSSSTSMDATAMQRAALQSELSDAIDRRDTYRRSRDAFRRRLDPIQRRLSNAYEEAELVFVPRFRTLAYDFIGLNLDIFLKKKRNEGFELELEVQGTRRNKTTELSESQRFFLDIALRMALLQHMTGGSAAQMLIDTPEGSLDISYEKRAGNMFAGFVNDGYQIVMTANINASQLLVQLASMCGAENMQLVRMTDWTPLSEVQAEAEDLFDKAYEMIEHAMQSANPQFSFFDRA